MRRRTGRRIKRGWVAITVLVVGGAACLGALGHEDRAKEANASPAQNVSLRFPEASPASADLAVATTVVGKRQLALFSPEPMAAPSAAPEVAAEPAAAAQLPAAAPSPAVHPAQVHVKPVVSPVHRAAIRPGFLLNDGQIASIKRRLNLTPDQERMWPAVEAALRNIAYAKAHADSHRAGRDARVQAAAVDPNSPEVQGLKSAAFPLIMSFNAEQKSEVRSLAHVMGLDRLAAQF